MKWRDYILGWLQVVIHSALLPLFAVFTLLHYLGQCLLCLLRRKPLPKPSDYVRKFHYRIIDDLIYTHYCALRGRPQPARNKYSYNRRKARRYAGKKGRKNKAKQPVELKGPHLIIPFDPNTPFAPDGHQVIFLDLSPDHKVTRFVEDNYDAICRRFAEFNLQFVYLPRYVKSLSYRTLLSYSRPDLDDAQIDQILSQPVDVDKIQQLLVSSAIIQLPHEPVLIRFKKSLTKQEALRAFYCGTRPNLLFSVRPLPYRKARPLRRLFYHYPEYVGEEPNRTFLHLELPEEDQADFSTDFEKISQEIRDRIDQLRQMGIDEAVLASLLQKPATLSRMRISRDFRIYLTDYNNREIKLPPLAKSLYFLFLGHPEGLLFKQVQDYRGQLLELYKNISNRENLDKMEASIDDLVNSTKNSINEKCSRIKEVFLCEFDDTVARNYYLVGRQMEPKLITLDRSLVTDETHLIMPETTDPSDLSAS